MHSVGEDREDAPHFSTVNLGSFQVLSVVQTQAILFLKSMSGRSGSDIERH